jgi:hypothetical protein
MTSDTPMDHDCEAYGPDLPDHCFVELAYGRCDDAAQCHATMMTERLNLWVRLLAMEQLGDELATVVLESISGPEDLLGGSTS